MRALRTVLAVGAIAAGLAIGAEPAAACQCRPQLPPQHAATADVVFTGTVVDVRESASSDRRSSAELVHVRIAVEHVFKGSVEVSATIRTARSDGACGYDFKRGLRYTVFAEERDADLLTSSCSGTVAGEIQPLLYGLIPPPAAAAALAVSIAGIWYLLARSRARVRPA